MANGQLLEPLPDAHQARLAARENIKKLPHALKSLYAPEEHPWRVEYSKELLALDARVRQNLRGANR